MTTIKTSNLPNLPSKHFCIAPFNSIRQNAYGRNSPCAFGAGEWHHGELTPIERWHSKELNDLRQQFIDGGKPPECQRCWNEEDANKKSLRQRQYEYFPNVYTDFIKTEKWVDGPMTAVFKTSNICNLACRSCGGWDTNSYANEGVHYANEYHTKINGELYNRFIPFLRPKHMEFMQYTDIAKNLEKIDFFGGEPFLNITQLDFLEYLVEQDLSKNITLFYSTNCTNHPTERLKKAWSKFKRIEISVSIDGINEQFEYMRYPGKWEEASSVLDHILSLKNTLPCDVYVMAGLTFSLLNVWYADDIYSWLKNKVGDVYINMVNSPDYLSLHIAPEYVKSVIRDRVKNSEILGYLDIKEPDPLLWKQFMIWTKRQDKFRNQSFESHVPNFFKIIKDDWDLIVDLMDDNFYKL
jgi:sulfatase maturation enzyme AslB (radical SAM superfamily)